MDHDGSAPMILSIIIPCYNESQTIPEILRRVEAVDISPHTKEIVLVDDGSTDGTRDLLMGYREQHVVLFHPHNLGKGAAIRTAIEKVTGDVVIIQDADLEYDPQDYRVLLEPILQGQSDVVYGTRIHGNEKAGTFYYLGGVFLSFLTNLLYRTKITDEPTCYKMFRADIIKGLNLKCQRFEFCPEVTAKILKRGIPIVERPISYHPRSKKEGKKIRLRDGLEAIWTLVKYRFVD